MKKMIIGAMLIGTFSFTAVGNASAQGYNGRYQRGHTEGTYDPITRSYHSETTYYGYRRDKRYRRKHYKTEYHNAYHRKGYDYDYNRDRDMDRDDIRREHLDKDMDRR